MVLNVMSRWCYSVTQCVAPVCLSVFMECITAERCVLEQNLLLTAYEVAYEKSIGTKMNDLDLWDRFKVMSTIKGSFIRDKI